jgi:hypothetical protein
LSRNVWIVSNLPQWEGIGSRLRLFSEAVCLGRTFGCPVIVDWRGTGFLKDKSLNYFTEFFVPIPEIMGVQIQYAPSPALSEYERASQGERLELSLAALASLVAEPPPTPRYLLTRHSLRLGRSPVHGDGYRAFLADFFRHIIPRAEVTEQLESWYEAHLRGHFVVGVNVSTGNGFFSPGGLLEGNVNTLIFDDEDRFLRTIAAACERATKDLPPSKSDYRIFFTTDSAHMAEVLGRLPRAVTRRTVFPPDGAGRRFCDYDALGYSDRAAAVDTIVDMLLLARCNALIKNRSNFNFYARATTGSFNGNMQRFEKLYRVRGAEEKAPRARWKKRLGPGARLRRLPPRRAGADLEHGFSPSTNEAPGT